MHVLGTSGKKKKSNQKKKNKSKAKQTKENPFLKVSPETGETGGRAAGAEVTV